MKKLGNMLHLSSLNLWGLGGNKGRLSIYLPLKAFAEKGYKVCYITDGKKLNSGNYDGIYIRQILSAFNILGTITSIKWFRILTLPITSFVFFLYGVLYSLRERPSVIYAHTYDTAIPAFLLSKIFKAKYILRLYGINLGYNNSIINKFTRIDLYAAFFFRADLYILTNDGTSADKYALSRGIPKDRIHFLKNGIDKSWATKPVNLSLKQKLSPNGEIILLSVSRLVKSKQVEIIIKALPELLKMNNKIKLIIVGDGNEKNNLEELVNELGVSNCVNFIGALHQSEVIDYMKVADLFISMNSLSSICNPVLEAMTCKKTVIALNTGRTEDLIKNDITGVLVNTNQIDKLPNIIYDILQDDEKRIKIGQDAQKYLLENWPSLDERINYEVRLIENLF